MTEPQQPKAAPTPTNTIDNILIEVRHGRMSNTKAKAAINKTIMEAQVEELQAVLIMNGWHEGDWKQAIKERIAELKKYGRTDNE